jgi:hypothetical protein
VDRGARREGHDRAVDDGLSRRAHAVGGAFPLDIVLGNAEVVTVTMRGAPLDTTQYVKQNVAKFQVK